MAEPRIAEPLIAELGEGRRVVARYGGFEIATDQAVDSGGDGAAPEPLDLFLASLATCAGAYVSAFCRQRDIPTDGVRVVETWARGESNRIVRIDLEIELPDAFPAKYRTAVVRAAEQCSVKKLLIDPPQVVTRARD